MKSCSCCKEIKDFSYFSPDKRVASQCSSRCKSCSSLKAQENRIKNPNKVKEAASRYAKAHPDTLLKRNSEYRSKNPEKVAEWKKKDRALNKSRIAADNAKRRVSTKGILSSEVKQMYALRDFYIAMSLGEPFHVDHIVPLSKGGLHEADNLQILPAVDNLRKGAKHHG